MCLSPHSTVIFGYSFHQAPQVQSSFFIQTSEEDINTIVFVIDWIGLSTVSCIVDWWNWWENHAIEEIFGNKIMWNIKGQYKFQSTNSLPKYVLPTKRDVVQRLLHEENWRTNKAATLLQRNFVTSGYIVMCTPRVLLLLRYELKEWLNFSEKSMDVQ